MAQFGPQAFATPSPVASTSRSEVMSHHRRSHGQLTRAATLLILLSVGMPAMASAKAGCSSADARTPATPAENACKLTPLTASNSYLYQTLDFPAASQTIFWGINDF